MNTFIINKDTEKIFESLPLGIVILSRDGTVIYANERALASLDIEPLHVLSKKFDELIDNDEIASLIQRENQIQKKTIQTTVNDRDIIVDFVSLSAAADNDPAFLLSIQDITQHKVLERMKMEFISEVLHKIRTPLTTVKSSLALAASGRVGQLSEKVNKIIQMSEAETDRLAQLLDSLRDLFLIEAGAMQAELDIEPVAVSKILEGACDDVDILVKRRNQTIKRNAGGEEMTVSGDYEKLRSIFGNILRNACMFSDEGQTIDLTVTAEDDFVKVTVKDYGVGIAEEDRDKIFEKFFRGFNEVTRAIEGNGLGLFLTKKLLEMQNAAIYLDSSPGKGTTVEVFLPKAT